MTSTVEVTATDDARRPRKRARISQTNTPNAAGSARAKPLRGRRGALRNLLEMPVDIMYEVFERLAPYDLLHLAQTTKALRKLLMNRSSAPIWRHCRSNIPGLPKCPADLSEPQYVKLMFDLSCNFCGSINVQYVVILARVRSCRKCGLTRFKNLDTQYHSPTSLEVLRVTPHTMDLPGGPAWMEGSQKAWVEEFHRLEAEGERKGAHRKDWLSKKRREYRARVKDAHIYTDFLFDQLQNRSDALDAAREKRIAMIIDKLKARGWTDDILRSVLYEHPELHTPKELTERSWKRLEPILVEFLETSQKKGSEFMIAVWKP